MPATPTKDEVIELLAEQVGIKLAFNQGAYGTPWTGEDEDARFIVAGAAERVMVMVNEARARLYTAIVDALLESADDVAACLRPDYEDAISPEADAIREAADSVLGKLYLKAELPRCLGCGSQVGTHHGPGCAVRRPTTVGSSVVTGLVGIDDCLYGAPKKESAA